MTTYTCPGLSLTEPEVLVACYRAGHTCPRKVAQIVEDENGRTITLRCPCCGDFGGATFTPWLMVDDDTQERVEAAMRAMQPEGE